MSKERAETRLNKQDTKEQSDLVCERETMHSGQSRFRGFPLLPWRRQLGDSMVPGTLL